MEQRIGIQELGQLLAERQGIKVREAQNFVKAVFDLIQETLRHDESVKVKGIGTFKMISVEARQSVHVATGERVLIEGHHKISFTPDATMRELVNKPFSQFDTILLADAPTPGAPKEPEIPEVTQEESFPEPTETPVVAPKEEVKQEEPPVVEPKVETAKAEQPQAEQPQVVVSPFVELPAEEPQEEVPSVEEPKEEEPQEEKVQDETEPDVASLEAEEEELVSDEEEEEEAPKSRWWLWLTLVLVVALLLAGGVYYYRQHLTATPIIEKEQPEEQAKPAPKAPAEPQPAPETAPEAAPATKEEAAPAPAPAEKDYAVMDERVRTGAYVIVGDDYEVNARPDETHAHLAKRTLGEGMECYIEVYNDIRPNQPLQAGQRIKIPKVQIKKKAKAPAAN